MVSSTAHWLLFCGKLEVDLQYILHTIENTAIFIWGLPDCQANYFFFVIYIEINSESFVSFQIYADIPNNIIKNMSIFLFV